MSGCTSKPGAPTRRRHLGILQAEELSRPFAPLGKAPSQVFGVCRALRAPATTAPTRRLLGLPIELVLLAAAPPLAAKLLRRIVLVQGHLPGRGWSGRRALAWSSHSRACGPQLACSYAAWMEESAMGDVCRMPWAACCRLVRLRPQTVVASAAAPHLLPRAHGVKLGAPLVQGLLGGQVGVS